VLLAVVFLLMFPSISFGGSLGYGNLSPYSEWEPDCYKPDPPSISVYDRYSFNSAVDEFNNFVSEASDYLSCIENEAEADISTARRAISNGFDEKQSEIIDEVESVKSELQSARYLID